MARRLDEKAQEIAAHTGISVERARDSLITAGWKMDTPACEGQCKWVRPHGPFWAEARGLRVTLHTCEAP